MGKRKEIIFQEVLNQIDPGKTFKNKKIKSETGWATGDFDILEPTGKKISTKLNKEKTEKIDINIEPKKEATVYSLHKNGQIIRSSEKEGDNARFFSAETGENRKINEPNTLVMAMILNSKPETGFVRKEDLFNKDINEKTDLMKNNSMVGIKILILNFYGNMDGDPSIKLAETLVEKACAFEILTNVPLDFHQRLFQSNILILISGYQPKLSEENITSILTFYDMGNSLYIFGDNAPFFVDANRITEKKFHLKLVGNDYGDQIISKVNINNAGLKTGFDENCPLFHGLQTLYEGVTLSHVVDLEGKSIRSREEYNGFKSVLWGTQNNVICAVLGYNE